MLARKAPTERETMLANAFALMPSALMCAACTQTSEAASSCNTATRLVHVAVDEAEVEGGGSHDEEGEDDFFQVHEGTNSVARDAPAGARSRNPHRACRGAMRTPVPEFRLARG